MTGETFAVALVGEEDRSWLVEAGSIITRRAREAGIEGRVSGHSLRVGAAQSLAGATPAGNSRRAAPSRGCDTARNRVG